MRRKSADAHETQWSNAKFIDGNGAIGGRIQTGSLIVPEHVEISEPGGEDLAWKGLRAGLHKPEAAMFNSFIRLWRQRDPLTLVRFAQKWGMLWLDGQAQPCGQSGTDRLMRGTEPVVVWKYISRRAYSIVNIAAALRQGKAGDEADWAFLESKERWGWWPEHGFWVDEKTAAVCITETLEGQARLFIQSEVTWWLRLSKISLGLKWSPVLFWGSLLAPQERKPKNWNLEIDFNGCLFAAVALQLAQTVVRGDVFICSGCTSPYLRPREEKLPKPGERNFCDECRQRDVAAPLRKANQTRQEKINMARQLSREGVSPKEIAKQLNVRGIRRDGVAWKPVDTVRRWIEKGK